MASEGVWDVYTTALPSVFHRPPFERAPSPFSSWKRSRAIRQTRTTRGRLAVDAVLYPTQRSLNHPGPNVRLEEREGLLTTKRTVWCP